VNSDADPGGYSNLAEINANTQPGWTPGAVNIIYNGDGTFVTGQNPPVGILGSLDPSSTTTTTSTSSTSSTSTSSTTTSATATSTSSTATSSQSSSSTSSTSTSSTTSTSDASSTSTTDTTATSTTASGSTTTTLPCGPSPLPSGCRLITVALKGSLQVKDNAEPGKDQVKWKWKLGAATSLGDFKDPVNGSASMQFCVYDNSPSSQPRLSAVLVPGGICGTKPCWKASGTTGYSMTNKVGSPQGLTKAKFKAGSAGKAQVQVQGKGVVLPPLPFTVPVTVQLLIADGFTTQCWQTTFPTFIKNDSLQFKAKGP